MRETGGGTHASIDRKDPHQGPEKVVEEVYLSEQIRCCECLRTVPIGVEVVTVQKDGPSKKVVKRAFYCRSHSGEVRNSAGARRRLMRDFALSQACEVVWFGTPTRADDCLQQHAQLLAVERLLQQRNMRVPFFEGVAVSGHERKGIFFSSRMSAMSLPCFGRRCRCSPARRRSFPWNFR